MHLSTGSSLFVTIITRSACIFLQDPLCLIQEELDQRASFYRFLSVCKKKNTISVHFSTSSSLIVTTWKRSACIFLHDPLRLFQEEQDQLASSYGILSVCYIMDKIGVDLSTSLCLLKEEQYQFTSFYRILSDF